MTAITEKIHAIDIRSFAESRLGLSFYTMPMVAPVTAILDMGLENPTITLNADLNEAQKYVAIASILAMCLEDGKAVNCIMTDGRSDAIAKRARSLLLPEKSFMREYNRLTNFGKLRSSLLATLFQVPLSEVLLKLQDLELEM